MLEPSTIVIYVADLEKSKSFYQTVLKIPGDMHSNSFVSFTFPNGLSLGLKDRATVYPASSGYGGGEIAFSMNTTDEVDILYSEWKDKGILMPEEPKNIAFGYTFVALDPDNHRIRVASLGKYLEEYLR